MAIVTGTVSGVVVLDVDPRAGGEVSLASLEQRWGPRAETVECETGGGGLHVWFASVSPVPSASVAPGCELKAEGGLVVVPPSEHASGVRYRWRVGRAPDERELAPIPSWLVELAVPEHTETRAGTAGQQPARTELEQHEFADAWTDVGVDVRDGDRMYLCPFHDDHHPSLHIDALGCRWFCFGCRRGGGIGALRATQSKPRVPRARHRLRELSGVAVEPVTMAGEVEVDIVGESAHQDALLTLTGGHRSYAGVDVDVIARLVADPIAPLDPNAVVVRIAGRTVGRLRREIARRYRTVFSYVAREHGVVTCPARIVGGWDRGRGDIGAFGVHVFLPVLDDVPSDEPDIA